MMDFNKWEFIEAYKEKVVEDLYDPVIGQESSYRGEDGMLFDSVSKIMKAVSVVEASSGDIFKESLLGGRGEVVLTKAQRLSLIHI